MQKPSTQGVGGAAVHVVPAGGLYPTLPNGEMDIAKIAEVEHEAKALGFVIELASSWYWRSSQGTRSGGFDSHYLAALDAVETVRDRRKMQDVARAALRELAINERVL